MDTNTPKPAETVSNLVPVWDEPDSGGGSYEPASAAVVVEQAVRVEQLDPPPAASERPRLVAPPEQFDPSERQPVRSAYQLLDDASETWAERGDDDQDPHDDLPHVDYDLLHRREIAKELLRARLVALAERRERRSAYEIVFIMLAAAVAVLLAAPPLVQVLLAARGIEV